MATKHGLSRRELFRAGIGVVGVSLLAACAPAAPAQPTAEPAKPAEAAKPAAPAPTTAPAPAAAAKPAEAPKPAAPAAAKPAEPKLGAQLIGKLEGPTIILDAAQFPKSFKEAPALAELVKAGTLPPVQERVSQDPLVIKPLREIGKYGGTLRRAFTGPGDKFNGRRFVGLDNVLYWDYSCTKIVPNIARGWEEKDGGRTLLINLRRGMKWSDGQPFTADDFMFWFEDMYQNKDLVPAPMVQMMINGKPVTLEKVDATTVAFRAPDPYPALVVVLTGLNRLGGQAENDSAGPGHGPYAPAHYLKQFHPKYTPQAQIDEKVKAAGFDNWVNLFKNRADWALNPDLPVVSPWKTVGPANTPVWSFERNPYSIWVDTEGNQLPYIDKVQMQVAENLEILNLRAIAGEIDFQGRHIDLGKLPVLVENAQKGNYKVHLDPANFGSDAPLRLNMSYVADPEVSKWLNDKDFRIAMSLGIQRDQLNEALWLGMGTPGSYIIGEDSPYSPGPEYRKQNMEYDPKKANEILDRIGLSKKDAEGYRVRTDNGQRLRIELMTQSGVFFPLTKVAEMVREHWKAIGLQADVKENERSLAEKIINANEHQIAIRAADGIEDIWAQDPGNAFPSSVTSYNGPVYGLWFASGGTQGKEPPPRMKEMMELYWKSMGVPDPERVQLGKQIWKILAEELWTIGTVGLSPATTGVRVSKLTLGNIPDRLFNSASHKSPGSSQPSTYYFKS
ncbi:MAG TPA: ABC transporter substrate-binding protein [Chloroflexota bacterium]|nr:ABC transporter substrate-binding protein [Chloroflexota bacterium]